MLYDTPSSGPLLCSFNVYIKEGFKSTDCKSSRLQLDVRHLSLGRRHLVKAYEVTAGIDVIAGKTV